MRVKSKRTQQHSRKRILSLRCAVSDPQRKRRYLISAVYTDYTDYADSGLRPVARGATKRWRGAALTRAPRPDGICSMACLAETGWETGGSRERPSVWLPYWPIGRRHWVKSW